MDALPDWRAASALQGFAYVHLAPSLDQMARTYQQAQAGLLPDEPVLVVGQPTGQDPSRAPDGKLQMVSLIDILETGLSAVYTFFDPDYADRSLGTFAILSQLDLARRTGRQWLYLGYLVEECRKMNYKRQYLPHELLVQGEWKKFDAKPE